MIRKTIIVVLTLGAVGTGILGLIGRQDARVWTLSQRAGRATRASFRVGVIVVVATDTRGFRSGNATPDWVQYDFARWEGGAPGSYGNRAVKHLLSFSKGVRFQLGGVRVWSGTVGKVATIEFMRPEAIRMTMTPPGAATSSAVHITAVVLPVWRMTILFAVYPLIAFIRGPLRRYRRRKRGLCVRCGYNLTGLTAPKCPECGCNVTISLLEQPER